MNFVKQLFVPETLEQAVQLAAQHLPDGYRIQITLEKEGYGFSLIKPSGEEVCFSSDDCLKSQIIEHVNFALEEAGVEE